MKSPHQLKSFYCDHQEPTRPAIPVLLAVGAVHQHLIQNGLRMSASIVADTAQCFSTHQFACLIGYGARSLIFYSYAPFYLNMNQVAHFIIIPHMIKCVDNEP